MFNTIIFFINIIKIINICVVDDLMLSPKDLSPCLSEFIEI